jgi:hypothetical protein
LAAARALRGPRPRWPTPAREHWTPAGRSRSRREAAEAEADVPVFQYVGERAARADRVFVWGFSFSGALGVPSFVVPSSGPGPRAGLRPRRRIQPVPYRLELDHKVGAVASSLASLRELSSPRGRISGSNDLRDPGICRGRHEGWLPRSLFLPVLRPSLLSLFITSVDLGVSFSIFSSLLVARESLVSSLTFLPIGVA